MFPKGVFSIGVFPGGVFPPGISGVVVVAAPIAYSMSVNFQYTIVISAFNFRYTQDYGNIDF